MKRTEIIEKLYNEGFTHETLSLLEDRQVYALAERVITEQIGALEVASGNETIRLEKCQAAFTACQVAVQNRKKTIQKNMTAASKQKSQSLAEREDVEDYNIEDDGTKTIDTDNMGNPDVDIKKGNKDKKDVKLITDKDGVEEVDEDMVEEWMTRVVNKNQEIISKSKLLEIIKNIQEDDIGGMTSDPELMRREYGDRKNKKHASGKVRYEDNPKPKTKLFSSVEQEYAFEQLNKYVLDLDGYQIMVDELEYGEDPEEAILNLFLASEAGFTWDIMIYTDGNIYMDGAPIQDSQDLEEEIREKESGGENWIEYDDDRPDNWRELPGYNPDYFYGDDSIFKKELAETERDTEGAYMGAPVGTEMPVKTPVRTPTITPTRPGRKRGPFTRPKTTPKPKAGKDKMPEWMGFHDIKSQTENS